MSTPAAPATPATPGSAAPAAAPQGKPVKPKAAHQRETVTAIVDCAQRLVPPGQAPPSADDARLRMFRIDDRAIPNVYSGSLVLVRPAFRAGSDIGLQVDAETALVGRIGTFLFAFRGVGALAHIQAEPQPGEVRRLLKLSAEHTLTPTDLVRGADIFRHENARILPSNMLAMRLVQALPWTNVLGTLLDEAGAPITFLVPSLYTTLPNAQGDRVPAVPPPDALAHAARVLAVYAAVFGGAATTPEGFAAAHGFDLDTIQPVWHRFAGVYAQAS